MKVIHIIPSAFHYFDDIRAKAFELVEDLSDMGVETEAYTIQYGETTKAIKGAVTEKAPSRTFAGNADLSRALSELQPDDIVHVHCPLLGAASSLIRFKKSRPKVPLLVSIYRPAALSDFFSLSIKFYNAYYLPKIFTLADTIFSFSKLVHLTEWNNKVQLIDEKQQSAPRPADFYNYIFNTKA